MSLLLKLGLFVGLTVMLGFPLGGLYLSLGSDGPQLLTIGVAAGGFLVGTFLVGFSQIARTWNPY